MDIGRWLQSLGLERYVQAFDENHIDAEVLASLTADDLIGLGVTSVGHRRKLLDAIAALRTDVGPALEPTAAALAAERRQLTVMFCDLVGSTALAARIDLEDLREVIAAYHRAVTDVVRSFDGFVAKYMGDGVLVYFGYPRAHGTMPSGRSGRGLAPSRLSVASTSTLSSCKRELGSPPGWWSSVI